MSNTKKLTVSALLVALATVLELVSNIIPAPWLQGGSITIASMAPIIMASVLFGPKWGFLTSFTYVVIQLFEFSPPPTQTFFYFVLVILLDYALAYGFLGFSGILYRMLGKTDRAAAFSAFFVTFVRYVCHILSGVLIWGVYAPEGQNVWAYSITYNGAYMIPEIIITSVAVFLITKFVRGHFKNFDM